jgi:hypothetical protein
MTTPNYVEATVVPGNQALYAFPGVKAGLAPKGLIRDDAGNLYGMTGAGGDLECDLTGSVGSRAQ